MRNFEILTSSQSWISGNKPCDRRLRDFLSDLSNYRRTVDLLTRHAGVVWSRAGSMMGMHECKDVDVDDFSVRESSFLNYF